MNLVNTKNLSIVLAIVSLCLIITSYQLYTTNKELNESAENVPINSQITKLHATQDNYNHSSISHDTTVNNKTEITLAEFNKMFKKDSEEKQYPNGKFVLRDGTIVNADYLSYSESELFDYASAISYNGELANLQIETSKPLNEIEKGLGVTLDKVRVDTTISGYEIIWNETFADENISQFPFELD